MHWAVPNVVTKAALLQSLNGLTDSGIGELAA